MKYYIRYEPMGGEWFYMIYRKRWIFHTFFERWNSSETVKIRLDELNKYDS